ncbi:MAG: RNA polymerase sigma factor [Acutalibacteraceae bacterium]
MDNGASSYRRFIHGDDAGLADIIDEYYDGLTFYLNTYVRNLNTAEELAEDTFVKLATKKPRFNGKSSFKTWLYSIGRNIAADSLRHNSKRDIVPIDEFSDMIANGDDEIEQSYLLEERKIIIHRAMQRLKLEYRQVLWLTYFEELSNKEVAQIMKKSLNSIEHLVSRARQSLKAELEKEDFIL